MKIVDTTATATVALVLVMVSLLPSLSRAGNAGQPVQARLEDSRIIVTVAGKLFTCYKFDKTQKYPYFWPVVGPLSGKSITTESSEPYPHHHSLFFACDRVNGGNYWQQDNTHGQILSQGPTILRQTGREVVFVDRCLWKRPSLPAVIEDIRRVSISAPSPHLRFIDFEITLKPLTDVRILKTNHSLFSARVMPELSVNAGGTLINAEGKTREKGTWGQRSPWCDYYGTRKGITEGIAILQHPANRFYPCRWFTRDYGFFSPTPMYWLEGGKLELPKGKPLTLRYRVVVHAGSCSAAGIRTIFQNYLEAADASRPNKTSAPDDPKCR